MFQDDSSNFCPCANYTTGSGGGVVVPSTPFRDDDHNDHIQYRGYDSYHNSYYDRFLEEDMSTTPSGAPSMSPSQTNPPQENELWEMIYTVVVLFLMFAALISDKIGADSVMMISLTLFMVSGIITVQQGIAGFANEGLLTVMVLFIVAAGVSKTGALDWYMQKLLGRPKTAASAQLRMMVPISIVSAFLNNTPVVAVMIPIVQKWARNINISAQQLLIPLSFSTILGGTCTIIGTSTNLVIVGLLQERYADDPSVDQNVGIFDLAIYGVPIAMVGLAYIISFAPWLIPGGSGAIRRNKNQGAVPLDMGGDNILLGARITAWSPAAGRSLKRSGLRDTGGIYLVSVYRSSTGNVHRAVGQEFILNVGDICYFTGANVEGFGEFCEEHGMEVLTNELEEDPNTDAAEPLTSNGDGVENADGDGQATGGDGRDDTDKVKDYSHLEGPLVTVVEVEVDDDDDDENEATAKENVPIVEVGYTKESLLQSDEEERSRSITRMIDTIRGVAREEPTEEEDHFLNKRRGAATPRKKMAATGNHKVVVHSEHGFVIVGVDARDRPGLLLDISKGLLRLNLTLRHSEASVVKDRSISIWRCEVIGADLPDLEEIWTVMNSLLEVETGSEAVKTRGLRVIRAVITPKSFLVGRSSKDANFRQRYKAAVVAVQKGGRNVPLSGLIFGVGDVLILQASDDSPLLKRPPEDFYKRPTEKSKSNGNLTAFVSTLKKTLSSGSLKALEGPRTNDADSEVRTPPRTRSSTDLENVSSDDAPSSEGAKIDVDGKVGSMHESLMEEAMDVSDEDIWKDLQVVFDTKQTGEEGAASREFLSAMQIAPKSKLAGQTVAQCGIDRLPGVFLVSIDRPVRNAAAPDNDAPSREVASISDVVSVAQTINFTAITQDIPLKEGDVLWFAGGAQSVGDLRKIPGLTSYESGEVEKINEKVHDRRLVEAVIARRGPLTGKTVKEVRFRTRYGAAVLAVHREGNRIHEHPGRIKLQTGDVLLLEAGPTFIKGSAQNDRAFSLVAEVEDSAPPRLNLLIPALVITIAMLAVATSGVASLLVCGMVATICMAAVGILSEQEVRDALNWEIYVIIAAAFGIGTAMEESGVAKVVADFLVSLGTSIGSGSGALFGAVYLATVLISNVVTNNAAAALMFPIAMEAADQTGTDHILMAYCLMLGASASFMSPFGYTTNLMVYGPGGYKYMDFVAIGTPMQLILWIFSIVLLETTTSTNFYISWLASFGALLLVAVLGLRRG
mmetsp:Transcript_5533/g.13341  ORF Transcript_5533/g.13341 Transcript_5533/m.13341 type:complete len:1248 (+) Transcript_5533:310-4053(+)